MGNELPTYYASNKHHILFIMKLAFLSCCFVSFFLDLILRFQTSWGEDLGQHLSNSLHYKSSHNLMDTFHFVYSYIK